MNMHVKLVKIGNSTGVILPKDVLAHLGSQQGDVLTLAKSEKGIQLQPYEADFEAQMAAARAVMARRKRALRELAK